jgi:hypothetical protein
MDRYRNISAIRTLNLSKRKGISLTVKILTASGMIQPHGLQLNQHHASQLLSRTLVSNKCDGSQETGDGTAVTTKLYSFYASLLSLVHLRLIRLERQFKKIDDMLHLVLDNFCYSLLDTFVCRNC